MRFNFKNGNRPVLELEALLRLGHTNYLQPVFSTTHQDLGVKWRFSRPEYIN